MNSNNRQTKLKMFLAFNMKTVGSYFLLFFLFFTSGLKAQDRLSVDSLLTIAGYHYNHDNLDSATIYYNKIYEREDIRERLEGLAGLIKVNIFSNSFSVVDSLITIGDVLIDGIPYSKEVGNYQIMKGEYYRKNSRYQEALETHKKTIEENSKLKNGKTRLADAMLYTALTYERLSNYDSSLVYANKAHDLYLEISDTTSTRFGSISNSLGTCYYRANHLDKAKKFYLQAKRIALKNLGPVSSDLSNALSNLSILERANQNYREAIKHTEHSLRINRALKDEDGMSTNYYSLGVYYYYLADYGRAKDYLEACIEIRERIFNPLHSRLVWPYQVLGIALQESGNFEATIQYNNKARKILIANFGVNSIEEGYLDENTASAYLGVQELDSALYYIKKASSILIDKLSEDDYSLGIHYFSQANIHYMREEYKEAQKYIQKSNNLFEKIGGDNNSDFAQNLSIEALIEAAYGNYSIADQLFEKALSIIRSEDSYEYSAPSFWVLGSYIDYLYDKYKINEDETVLGDFETFSSIYLDMSNKFRRQFNDPYTKSALIIDNVEVYNRNIGIAFQLYQKLQDKKYLNMAYDFSESGRTALLRDMQDGKVQKYAGVSDSLRLAEVLLKKEITNLNQLTLEYPDSVSVRKDLFLAKESLNDHMNEVLKINPKYYEAIYNTTNPSLLEIQESLVNDENIIEYMKDDTSYYAIVVNKENYEFIHLGDRMTIEEQIHNWRENILKRSRKTNTLESFSLYKSLVKSLEPHLNGSKLIIIPTGLMFYLNFETLTKNKNEQDFLIYDYNISYALSINVLLSDNYKKDETLNGIAVSIAPGFEDEIKDQYTNQLDSLEFKDEEFMHTVRQPWSLKLVTKLEKLYQNNALTGTDATEYNVKNNINKGNLLYFGTHAITNPIDPIRSKLVLAKEIGPQKEDGYLHAYELFGFELESDLAILNACESGIGNLKEGEGMISLAYSLNFAGCPSTVMSLWKVDEKISTYITELFIENLSNGQAKSQALRNAKLKYLEQVEGQLRSPFYWSGMVLMGKDGDIHLHKKSPILKYALGLLILIIILFILFKIGSPNKID